MNDGQAIKTVPKKSAACIAEYGVRVMHVKFADDEQWTHTHKSCKWDNIPIDVDFCMPCILFSWFVIFVCSVIDSIRAVGIIKCWQWLKIARIENGALNAFGWWYVLIS